MNPTPETNLMPFVPTPLEEKWQSVSWRTGLPLPEVNESIMISGANMDNTCDQDRHWYRATVLAYTKDGLFVCLQSQYRVWPTTEMLDNCWFKLDDVLRWSKRTIPPQPIAAPLTENKWRVMARELVKIVASVANPEEARTALTIMEYNNLVLEERASQQVKTAAHLDIEKIAKDCWRKITFHRGNAIEIISQALTLALDSQKKEVEGLKKANSLMADQLQSSAYTTKDLLASLDELKRVGDEMAKALMELAKRHDLKSPINPSETIATIADYGEAVYTIANNALQSWQSATKDCVAANDDTAMLDWAISNWATFGNLMFGKFSHKNKCRQAIRAAMNATKGGK